MVCLAELKLFFAVSIKLTRYPVNFYVDNKTSFYRWIIKKSKYQVSPYQSIDMDELQ